MSLDVELTAVRRINAPRQLVWQVFCDVMSWPQWIPEARSVRCHGGPPAIDVGARLLLDVRPLGLPVRLRAHVARVTPGRRVDIVVRWLGVTGWQSYIFDDMGDGSLVQTRERLSGWLLGPLHLLRATRRVGGMVGRWLEALAVEAQRRHQAQAEATPPPDQQDRAAAFGG